MSYDHHATWHVVTAPFEEAGTLNEHRKDVQAQMREALTTARDAGELTRAPWGALSPLGEPLSLTPRMLDLAMPLVLFALTANILFFTETEHPAFIVWVSWATLVISILLVLARGVLWQREETRQDIIIEGAYGFASLDAYRVWVLEAEDARSRT